MGGKAKHLVTQKGLQQIYAEALRGTGTLNIFIRDCNYTIKIIAVVGRVVERIGPS